MALVTPIVKYTDGRAHRTALYLLTGVSNLDTVDLSADYTKILNAVALVMTGGFSIAVTSNGTSVLLTAAQFSLDAVYLLVVGAATPGAGA